MKKILKSVLKGVNILKIIGDTEYSYGKLINGIYINSKNVKYNTIFVANKGINTNGNFFIEEAICNGANVIICEKPPVFIHKNITYIIVNDSTEALGIISSNYYNNPTNKINLIGITGTNGKTTVAVILHKLFSFLGEKNVLISTIGIRILSNEYSTEYTTPNIIDINKYLYLSIKKGCKYAFMEVSSHGIHQKRIFGLFFKGAVFTNITHDHLDYHKSFNNYLSIKKNFFNKLSKKSFSIINIDDKNYSKIIKDSINKIYFYGIKNKNSDFKLKILNKSFDGTKIIIDNNKININLIGTFNAYNILASYATSVLLGIDKKIILKNLSLLNPIVGRFDQYISKCGKRIIIDYAHNPNGLKNIIDSVREIIKNINTNLICVIGCGGNRDVTKRSKMGKIIYEKCDISIFTSDNPRIENPSNIIMDMKKLISNKHKKSSIITIINRKKAINNAIKLSNKGDIILIMGKGHENYQEIKGIRYPFNDMDIVKNFFRKKNDY
ncbi:UDP-N-acetylmuramoyl-L-alanyl-D-glutamate--2,6-diaminopimelate ligase [Blattabacterium cuenoti]|uniref:UDP-N-acetylmuramoyl-L-alanyl-D-glutamate--2, 6-diaminopimelate ligase n=1 Tax=Blattabacterium cuenoti TaxID=1653831 RepID=UPI00163BC96E|nr:UDP-N-acetylmuramoyl-L-alanyl-D-glutamate--2,6-diaminopimelate ligase [Blattabacterium cuenoti]